MKTDLLQWMCCPSCKGDLTLVDGVLWHAVHADIKLWPRLDLQMLGHGVDVMQIG